VCGDLKVTNTLIGQESAYTECFFLSFIIYLFIYLWGSRAQSMYWKKKQAVSDTMLEGIIHESIVDLLQSSIAFAAYESGLLDPLCGGSE
jgi:hypothetical protein